MMKHATDLVTAFANQGGKTHHKAKVGNKGERTTRRQRDIGPLGTAARLMVGIGLLGSIVYGQFIATRHPASLTWGLGLLGFPALMLMVHAWRLRRNTARFSDTSPLSFVLSLALPLIGYLTGWVVPPLRFTSDATLIFVGSSMVLAALRGTAGCEFLAVSNWLLHRSDQLACAIWTPIDWFEQRSRRS